ncbi:MAG TPA: long-chain fatty acid--CoA ligase [Candidatus Eisenbacteria bacterium]|jgi:long-chain acyl-CoA synthetase|nr:long-chain fatty acid--CoA ligase [Candidatus Eisenbacteria bacterium]
MDVRTVPELLRRAAERHPKPDAFCIKREGRWIQLPLDHILRRSALVMRALRERGIKRGDRVVILGESSIEWVIADVAILSIGAVTVPIYPTLPASQIAPLIVDSGSRGAFASTAELKAKLEQAGVAASGLEWAWCWQDDPFPEPGEEAYAGGDAAPEDLASIIYTSGTTGVPKGVMLTHANIVAQALLSLKAMSVRDDDVYLSFLPLSHVFERCSGLYTMIDAGATITYAESIDRMAANLQECRPTIMLAVPRFYEKFYARVMEVSAAAGFPTAPLFAWARRVAIAWATRKDERHSVGLGLAFQHALANALVYRKLGARLGGRLRLRVSGGAALNREVALFFYGVGQPIHEGYGLSETTSAISVNRFGDQRIGTVGTPFDEIEVKIAEDGEILVKGPVVMKGYWNRPEETAQALEGGWFHTGDIGAIDPDGHIRITDRKKDIIVTSGGKKVPPQMIENALKESPRIHEVLVLGEGRKYIAALIVPEGSATREEIAPDVERVNAGLANFEKIRRFEVIPNDLSVANGTLTPSLKLKRQAVADKHRDLIQRLFAES